MNRLTLVACAALTAAATFVLVAALDVARPTAPQVVQVPAGEPASAPVPSNLKGETLLPAPVATLGFGHRAADAVLGEDGLNVPVTYEEMRDAWQTSAKAIQDELTEALMSGNAEALHEAQAKALDLAQRRG